MSEPKKTFESIIPPNPQLFNTDGKEINPYWIDPNQPLFIPKNPLHYKAHRIQIMLAQLEVQMQRNPAQFNAKNWFDMLEEYTKCVEQIVNPKPIEPVKPPKDDVKDDGHVDKGKVASSRAEQHGTRTLGDRKPAGVDPGVSTVNPLARKRANSSGAMAVPAAVPAMR